MKKRSDAKQRIFIREYLKDKNGARAARAAGYSARTARTKASQLLTKVSVAQAVEAGLAAQSKKLDITAERTVQRIAEFAFDKNHIQASDTLKACEMLGKHFKMFTDPATTSVNATLIVVNEAEVKATREKIKSIC